MRESRLRFEVMPRRTREAALSPAKKLTRQLPKLSPLLREGFRSLWSEKQCEAWTRRAKPADVLKQAQEWLTVAATALSKDGAEDVPYSKQRLAWLAELTALLEDEVAGSPRPELVSIRQARDGAFEESTQVRARLRSRMELLVGGDEERGAALAIAHKGDVMAALKHLVELLTRWRRDARLRLLADELGLDESMLVRAEGSARLLEDAELKVVSVVTLPAHAPVSGRVLRELRALQRAFAAAREEGLKVPALKVQKALHEELGS